MDEQLPDIADGHPDFPEPGLNPDAEPFQPRPLAEILPMEVDEALNFPPRPELIDYVDLERELILEPRYEQLAELQDLLEDDKNEESLRLAKELNAPTQKLPPETILQQTKVYLQTPLIIGNRAVHDPRNSWNLDVLKMRRILDRREDINWDLTGPDTCRSCGLRSPPLRLHTAKGPFAPRHSLALFKEPLRKEFLFHLRFKKEDDLYVSQRNNFKVNQFTEVPVAANNLDAVTLTCGALPEDIKKLLVLVNPEIICCGEHGVMLPSIPALIMHLVLKPHKLAAHLCGLCKNIIEGSRLTHLLQEHVTITFSNFVPLHDLAEMLVNKCNLAGKRLTEIFYTSQVSAIRESQLESLLKQSQNSGALRFDTDQLIRFTILATIRPGFPLDNFPRCSRSALPRNNFDLLCSVVSKSSLLGSLVVLDHLTQNLAPAEAAYQFLTTNCYPLLQCLIEARREALLNKVEYILEPNCLKTGPTKHFGIILCGPNTAHSSPEHLEDMDFSPYDVAIVGTYCLKFSGSRLPLFAAALNMSPVHPVFITSGGYAGLKCFKVRDKITMVPETQDNFFQIKLSLDKLDPRISVLIEFSLHEHLHRIHPTLWTEFVETEAEELILHWLKDIDDLQRRELPEFTKKRLLIVVGQGPLYHPDLQLTDLSTIENKINWLLSKAAIALHIPLALPTMLVGISGNQSLPLQTWPREAVFDYTGSFTAYTRNQIYEFIFNLFDIFQVFAETVLYPQYRLHH